MFPAAEAAYKEILTLPLWPGMAETDIARVAGLLRMEHG
jgi:dTDP-4-amino-4,6-dideoxygalactose transaminase